MFRGHQAEVRDVVFSTDGSRIISSSVDGTVRVWDVEPRTPETLITKSAGWMRTSLFSPNSNRLVTREIGKGGLKVWDVTTGSFRFLTELTLPFPKGTGPGDFSPDGKT